MAEDQEFTLPPLEERPLVTFALFAYNQEKYIREAVEGAFAQTYEPLEIILSDDCSTDRTFEIIQELASLYVGSHKLIINRNPSNFGISAHVRHIHQKAHGSYVIHAAGDDISLPQRTKTLLYFFLGKNPPSLIMSNSLLIDNNSKPISIEYPLQCKNFFYKSTNPLDKKAPGGGQTVGLSKALIEAFLDPDPRLIAEDQTLWVRANLVNGILYIPYILVKYRLHENGAYNSQRVGKQSNKKIIADEIKWSTDKILRLEQAKRDIIHINHSINKEIEKKIEDEKEKLDLKIKMLTKNLLTSTFSLIKLTSKENNRKNRLNIVKIYIIRWMPLLRCLKSAFSKLSRK